QSFIPNGIDLAAIQAGRRIESLREIGIIYLMQVSRFEEPKDQPTLIKALRYLPQNTHLILVGDGSKKSDCEDLVNKLALNERVLFLGARNDVPDLMQTADILVLSSYYEGLSLACLEALASGRPLVAADVPGIREVV